MTLSGCLVADTDHCIYQGGSPGCDAGELCVLAAPRHADSQASGVSDIGCFSRESEPPSGFIEVRYGLPLRLEIAEGGAPGFDSVEGRLHALDPSAAARTDMASFDEVFRGVGAIRRKFEDGGKSRKAAFELSAEEADAIKEYGNAIDQWLAANPSGTDTDGTDGTATDDATDDDPSVGTGNGSTGSQPCADDDECPDATPFCNPAQVCVACSSFTDSNAACSGLDPSFPICIDGECVQCEEGNDAACVDSTPICDIPTNSCIGCTAHSQCGEAACNLFTGECLPDTAVFHVGEDRDIELPSEAVELVPLNGRATIIIHGSDAFNDTVALNSGRVVAFIANSGDLPIWSWPAGSAPQISVASNATVLLDRLQISGNNGDTGLVVNGGQAWVDRSRLVSNNGGGVQVSGTANVVVRNSFIGGPASGVGAIDVAGVPETSLEIQYSTIIGGFGGQADALRCTGDFSFTVSDSIILTIDPAATPVDCLAATFDHSASEMVLPGPDNVDTPSFDDGTGWIENVPAGNFSLTPSGASLFENIALWQTGDPPTDIHQDMRPLVDDTPDYPGADVP